MKLFCSVILLVFLLFQYPSRLYGERDCKDMVHAGYMLIYNFDFAAAAVHADETVALFPEVPESHLLAANYYWWLIITGEDNDQNRSRFNEELRKTLEILYQEGRCRPATMQDIFNSIMAYAYLSRLDVMAKNRFRCLLHVSDCMKYLKQSFGKEDRFLSFNLTSGLYNYFIAYGIENHPLFYPTLILMPPGSRETGLRQLAVAAASADTLISTEGNYFLLKILSELENNYEEAGKYAAVLADRFRGNMLYQYLYFRVLLDAGKKAEAQHQLEKLHLLSRQSNGSSGKQKSFFLGLASDDLKNYYLQKK